jgi:hypothetical protein
LWQSLSIITCRYGIWKAWIFLVERDYAYFKLDLQERDDGNN